MTYLVSSFQLNRPEAVQNFMALQQHNLAEVVDDSNKRPNKTIFCVLDQDDTRGMYLPHTVESINMLVKMLNKNGVKCYRSLLDVASHLNREKRLGLIDV